MYLSLLGSSNQQCTWWLALVLDALWVVLVLDTLWVVLVLVLLWEFQIGLVLWEFLVLGAERLALVLAPMWEGIGSCNS